MEITKKQIEKQLEEGSGLITEGMKYCSITDQVIKAKRMYVLPSFFPEFNLSKLENIYIPVDITELFIEQVLYKDADGDFHEYSFRDWLYKLDVDLALKTNNNFNEYNSKKFVEVLGDCVAISGELLDEVRKATQEKRTVNE